MTTETASGPEVTAIRDALARFGRLTVPADTVAPEVDLYSVGFTSHAAVNVMLALEDALELEFPDELMSRATFGSIAALVDAIRRVRES